MVAGWSLDRLRGGSDRPGRNLHAGVGLPRRGWFIRADRLAKLDIRWPGGVARRRQWIGLQRLGANLGSVWRSNLAADLSERRSPPCDKRYEQLRKGQRFGKSRRAR